MHPEKIWKRSETEPRPRPIGSIAGSDNRFKEAMTIEEAGVGKSSEPTVSRFSIQRDEAQ